MKILKFNENNDDALEYIKNCFIDIIDQIGYSNGGDGIFFENRGDRYLITMSKYNDDREYKRGSFQAIYNWAESEFEYIKNIKEALDKVEIEYPNLIDFFDHGTEYQIFIKIKKKT